VTSPAQGDAIAKWLKDQVESSGAQGIAVGLSGGIDSAVVLALAARATPGRIVGVLMPCHSDPLDEEHARLAAGRVEAPVIRLDLGPTYDRLADALRAALDSLPGDRDRGAAVADDDIRARLPLANVKPRLRMTSLYFVANSLNYLVAGTGNRSELSIGYFTKYGDGGVDLLPLGRLLKNEVRALARELKVPAPIIDKPPSAGLWTGQTDEHEMGFSYDELEGYLTKGAGAVSPAVAAQIERFGRASDHKRALPPMPEA
jgi:NAD+ synthase